MRLGLFCLACGVAGLAVACQRGQVGPSPLAPVPPGDRLLYDDQTGYRDSVTLVIRDPTEWGTVWRKANQNQTTVPQTPQVDFSTHMVLVVGAGRKRPGDLIRVDSLGVRNNRLVAVVRIVEECQQFETDVYPLEIVKVARDTREVLFDVRTVRRGQCQSD